MTTFSGWEIHAQLFAEPLTEEIFIKEESYQIDNTRWI